MYFIINKMKGFLLIAILVIILTFANADKYDKALRTARCLMKNKLSGVISSRYYSKLDMSFATNDQTFSFASHEDFVESHLDNGDPMFLLANVSQASKNLRNYSYGSFTVYSDKCPFVNYNNFCEDPLACPRLTFVGEFVFNPNEVFLTSPGFVKYVEKHPTAIDWITHSRHTFNLWYFSVMEIHYIGGYGNLHYIGQFDLDDYSRAIPSEHC